MNIIKHVNKIIFTIVIFPLFCSCHIRKKLNLEPIVHEIINSDGIFRSLNGYILFNESGYFENDGLQLSLFINENKSISSVVVEKITLLTSNDELICSKVINHEIELEEREERKIGYFSTLEWLNLEYIQNVLHIKNQKKLFTKLKNEKQIKVVFLLIIEGEDTEEELMLPFIFSVNSKRVRRE